MGKYFKNKYCVYLDQFAVSNCALEHPSDEWVAIKELIVSGVQNGTLFIPYSQDHLLESAHKDLVRAREQDQFLFELSGGLSIRTEPDMTERLMMNYGRKRPIGVSNFCVKLPVMGFDLTDGFGQYRGVKSGFNAMIEEGATLLNLVRPLTALTPRHNQAQREEVILARVKYYESEVVFRLKRLARQSYWAPKVVPFAVQPVPFWADAMMQSLMHKHNMTRVEARRIKEAIEKGGMQAVAPPLYIRANLEAAMALKHQKETPNDYLDVQRLAAALPVADIVLTDKAKCHDVKTLALNKLFKTEIYSGSRDDLQRFSLRLQEIIHHPKLDLV